MIEIGDSLFIKEDDYFSFFSKSSLIISPDDRRYKQPENIKKFCLLFIDGDVIVERNNKNNLGVRSYLTACVRRGYAIKNIYLADMSLIRRLYETSQDGERKKLKDEQPMERLAAQLLKDACSAAASDIHIEINEHEAAIFFRINGDMQKIDEIESETAHALISALYNAADNADATYKLYAYQSARISNGGRLVMPPELQSLRLQFNPLTSGGRYLVARLLYANKTQTQRSELCAMGFHRVHAEIVNELMMEPEGVIFIAGPTGSGKSTTLKTILENIYVEKERKVNIISIEDPPEYQIEGTTQLPVTNVDTEEERGAAYNKAIISALRSDPDIIMPGEARDAAVINLVFTAAMTGHQVWTSIHANSAMAVIARLRDQGVEQYKISDPKLLTGIVSQRLVKQLCSKCKIPLSDYHLEGRYGITLSSAIKDLEGFTENIFFNNSQGCDCCTGGYAGRSVVAEIIKTDYKILELICQNEIVAAYKYWRESLNGITLAEHGWMKIIDGLIDPFDARLRLGGDSISETRKIYLSNIT